MSKPCPDARPGDLISAYGGLTMPETADQLHEALRRARIALAEYDRDVRDGLIRHNPSERRGLLIHIDACQEALTNHYRLAIQERG